MKASIVKKILAILISLTLIFTLNTLIGGITNSQVSLSANLMSKVFVPLASERVGLTSGIERIHFSIGNTLNDDRGEAVPPNFLADEVTTLEESYLKVKDIISLSSEMIMSTTIEVAYSDYEKEITNYLSIASRVLEAQEQGDTTALQLYNEQSDESYELLQAYETHFDEVVNESLDHETKLINSRLLRASIIIWGMGLLFLIAVIVGFLVTIKAIIKPLRQANNEIQYIVEGINLNEGDLTIRLQAQNDDEIGMIIQSVNGFIEVLQRTMVSIKYGTETINHSTKNIDSYVTRTQDSINVISAAMVQLSASMEEISSTTQNIDEGSTKVYDYAKLINQASEENTETVKQMVEQAQEVHQKTVENKMETENMINDIESKISDSLEKSKSISKISELTTDILDISSQTNLLALNASIEAARAGDAGKGFAVVAEEIRSLSENTKNTANDIKQISLSVIHAVQVLMENSKEMVMFIQNNILLDYAEFVRTSQGYNRDLSMIKDIFSHFSEQSSHLQSISGEMAQGVNEISLAIEESVNGVVDSSENVNDIVIMMNDINEEMDTNKTVVFKLNEEMAVFKYIE